MFCLFVFLSPLQEAGDASPIVQWTGGKDFARGTNFSCMATSGAGHVVVGSRDGKIRLYSSKTLTQVRRAAGRAGLGRGVRAETSTDLGRADVERLVSHHNGCMMLCCHHCLLSVNISLHTYTMTQVRLG
jgi:hypothetical protein